jgi:nicotinate-nucleotide adenylyltransferase
MKRAPKTAMFGGTFDPIHRAHLVVATEAANRFALDQVLFVPAGNPPHKSIVTSYEDRYHMVEIACSVDPRFVPSRLEADRAHKSYSIETIERASRELISDPLLFIIGADAFEEITTWHRWQDVVHGVEFIVVARPGHVIEPPPYARVHRLETLALPVSSSEIRHALSRGEIPTEVPALVLDYIRQHHLYQRQP